MKSRHSTKSRQPHVNEDDAARALPKGSKQPKPAEVHVELAWAEPGPESDGAWRDFIGFLIGAQLENLRQHFGEAGPIALLKYVDEGKIDPGVLIGLLPPSSDEADAVDEES